MLFEHRVQELTLEQRELFERFLKHERLTLGSASTYRAPSNATEGTLARIWSDLLGVDPGVDDNYFELGGDSLAIIRMVGAARSAGIPLQTAWVFSQPTIAGLASLCRLGQPEPTPPAAPSSEDFLARIRAVDPGFDTRLAQERGARAVDAFPLSPSQQGILFHALEGSTAGSYVVQWTFTVKGRFDPRRFEAAWARVIQRHDVFRTMFQWIGLTEPLQVVLDRADVVMVEEEAQGEWFQQSADLSEEQRRTAFDLGRPPLMRIHLLRTRDEEWFCVVTHHHLIMDGWSQQIVLQDLLAAYRDLPLPAAAAGVFRRHVEWLRSKDQSAATDFWRRRFAGYRPVPVVARAADGQVQSSIVRTVPHAGRLREVVRQAGVTLSVFYQAAWALALTKLLARTDVAFGVTLSGRTSGAPGIENAVGMFINTLPLRVTVDVRASLASLLGAVQRAETELVEHEWCELRSVQNCINRDRREPLLDSVYVYERFPVDLSELELAEGLVIRGVEATAHEHYPLVFIVQDEDEATTLTLKHFAADHQTVHRLDRLLAFIASVPRRFIDTPGADVRDVLDPPFTALLPERDAHAD